MSDSTRKSADMSFADAQPPPAKKRRFFVDASPIADRSCDLPSRIAADEHGAVDLGSAAAASTAIGSETDHGRPSTLQADVGFDRGLLETIVGESLDSNAVRRLREASGNNTERGNPVP